MIDSASAIFYFKETTANIQSVKVSPNPAYVRDADAVAFNDTEGISRFNITASLKVDVNVMRITFVFLGKTEQSKKEFDWTIMRGNVDSCKIVEGVLGAFIQRIILEHSNYDFKCPIRKGDYYLINVPVYEFMPTFVPGLSGDFLLTLICKGKIGNAKRWVHLAKAEVSFSGNK